jgi:hypothetical protein
MATAYPHADPSRLLALVTERAGTVAGAIRGLLEHPTHLGQMLDWSQPVVFSPRLIRAGSDDPHRRGQACQRDDQCEPLVWTRRRSDASQSVQRA